MFEPPLANTTVEATEEPAAEQGGGTRLALFVASFILGAAGLLFGLFQIVDRAGIVYADVALDVPIMLNERLPALAATAGTPGLRRVAYLADSTAISRQKALAVDARLEKATAKITGGEPRIEVHSLATAGLGPFDYYFIAEEVIRAQPDLVVLLLNLTTFSDSWRRTFNRRELSGWIPPKRLLEAISLPLYWMGLTSDQLLLDVALEQAGLLRPWRFIRREQARVVTARNRLKLKLGELFENRTEYSYGLIRARHLRNSLLLEGGRRYNAKGQLIRFGPALAGVEADHPNLQLLAAAVRTFEQAGVPTLVYVNPTNIEHTRKLGVLDERGLQKTLDNVERKIREAGGDFADLHALFPDAAFRDAAGHFTVRGGEPDGPKMLAEALAPPVVANLLAEARGSRVQGD